MNSPSTMPAVSQTQIQVRSVRAWLLRTEEWRARWPRLEGLVSAMQRQRFAAIRDPQRQSDRLLAHALHRQVLAEAVGMRADHLPLFRSTTGQPRLALPGLATSLAHADGVIAIALAEGGPVGIDVEMVSTPSLRPIADLVCSPLELERLRDDEAGLLALWVRKEAVLKATGLGLARAMAGFEADEGAVLRLRDAEGRRQRVQVHTLGGLHECIVAVAAAPGLVPRWTWRHP